MLKNRRVRNQAKPFSEYIQIKASEYTLWLGTRFSDETEFRIADIRWRELNIETVTEGLWVENPNLSKVSEVGFTDLMAGGGTPASSRLDWIEVYGKPVIVKSDP